MAQVLQRALKRKFSDSTANVTTVIFMGDIWKPRTQWDSRYLWMPLELGDGKLRLPEPKAWTLDVKSGEAVISRAQSS